MATIYQQIFSGTDGGPWPHFTVNAGSCSILSGKGRQATAATAFANANAYYNVPSIPQAFTLTVDVTLTTVTGSDYYIQVAVRGGSNNFTGQWIRSSWEWQYYGIGGSSLYRVNSSGVNTFLASTGTADAVQGDIVHIKIAPSGSVFRIKLWKNAETEPASYTTFDDGVNAPTGTRIMLGTSNGNDTSAQVVNWDDLLIVDTVVTGTLARTLGPVTAIGFGSSATVLGTLAETLDNTVVQAVGKHGVAGTVARTLANATSVASGATSGAGVTGTVAVTLEGVEVGSPLTDDAGNPILDGLGAPILDQNGLQILDENGLPILDEGGNPILVRGAEGTHTVTAGTGLAVTLANLTIAAFGVTGNVTGTLARTLGAVTSAAVGTRGAVGALAETLDNTTIVAAGTVSVVGTAARTLGNVTSAASGTHDPAPTTAGNLAVTLAAVVATADGSSVAGTVAANLDAVTSTAEGTAGLAPVTGTAAVVTANVTAYGEGVHGVSGTVDVTLGALTSAGSSGGGATGTLDVTLDDVESTGVGSGSFSDFHAVTVRERGHAITVRERSYAVAVREWN